MGDNGDFKLMRGLQSARGSSFKGLKFGTTFAGATAKGSGRHTGAASEEAAYWSLSDLQTGDRSSGDATITVVNIIPRAGDLIVAYEQNMTDLGSDADGARTVKEDTTWSVFAFDSFDSDGEEALFWFLGNGVTIDYEIFYL